MGDARKRKLKVTRQVAAQNWHRGSNWLTKGSTGPGGESDVYDYLVQSCQMSLITSISSRVFASLWLILGLTSVASKGTKRSIAVRNKHHRYGNSHTIWDHTVLPATRQRWHSHSYPSRSWYSIKRPRRDARLSWPSRLVTYRDGIPARRLSPIQVLTGPDID